MCSFGDERGNLWCENTLSFYGDKSHYSSAFELTFAGVNDSILFAVRSNGELAERSKAHDWKLCALEHKQAKN